MLGDFYYHGAIAGPNDLAEKRGKGFAMAGDVAGLASADIGDESDGEGQIGFLPKISDLAWLAIVDQAEVGSLKVRGGGAIVSIDSAGDGYEIDIDADVGGALRTEGRGIEKRGEQGVSCHLVFSLTWQLA